MSAGVGADFLHLRSARPMCLESKVFGRDHAWALLIEENLLGSRKTSYEYM